MLNIGTILRLCYFELFEHSLVFTCQIFRDYVLMASVSNCVGLGFAVCALYCMG